MEVGGTAAAGGGERSLSSGVGVSGKNICKSMLLLLLSAELVMLAQAPVYIAHMLKFVMSFVYLRTSRYCHSYNGLSMNLRYERDHDIG